MDEMSVRKRDSDYNESYAFGYSNLTHTIKYSSGGWNGFY